MATKYVIEPDGKDGEYVIGFDEKSQAILTTTDKVQAMPFEFMSVAEIWASSHSGPGGMTCYRIKPI